MIRNMVTVHKSSCRSFLALFTVWGYPSKREH
jgi:hypothetical protein